MINVDEAVELFDRPISRHLEARIKKALKTGSEKIFWYTDSKIVVNILEKLLKEGNWEHNIIKADSDFIIRILVKKSLIKKVNNV